MVDELGVGGVEMEDVVRMRRVVDDGVWGNIREGRREGEREK